MRRCWMRVAIGVVVALLSVAAQPIWAQGTRPAGNAPGLLPTLPAEAVANLLATSRPDAPATLFVANRAIVTLRASVLDRSSAERVAAARERIAELIDTGGAAGTRVYGPAIIVTVGARDVLAIVPADVDTLAGETLDGKAAAAAQRLQVALSELKESREPARMAWEITAALVATVALVLLLWVFTIIHRKASDVLEQRTARHLARSAIGDTVVRETALLPLIRRSIGISLSLLGIVLMYAWFAFILRRFPYTRPIGESLRALLFGRVLRMGRSAIEWLPDLVTIVVIVIITRVVIRFVQVVFMMAQSGRVALPLVHADTAVTSRKIITTLVAGFAVIMAVPYLPGSDTEAFKGVSVFLGVILSLGSGGIANQLMSGLTLTYSRALRAGEFIRVGDLLGTVSQAGLLSTKLVTTRQEEITIPNGVLIAQSITNYSRIASTLVPAEVTIGYDVPWRQVEAMLLLAAQRTPGIRSQPAPIVRQVALEDFFVRYSLLVALDDPAARIIVLDQLHRNIQDAFNEHGVQIMSPHYESDPAAPKVIAKERWFVAPASTPGSR